MPLSQQDEFGAAIKNGKLAVGKVSMPLSQQDEFGDRFYY